MVKVIAISKKPKFIVVTDFGVQVLNYWIDTLNTVNKYSDIGVWHLVYK